MPAEIEYRRASASQRKSCHAMRTVYHLLHERRAHPYDETLPLSDIPLGDVNSLIKTIDDANVMGFIHSQVEHGEQDLPFHKLSAALRHGTVRSKNQSISQRLNCLEAWRDTYQFNGNIPQGGEEQPVGDRATPGDNDEIERANLSWFGRLYANLIDLIMDLWEGI